MKKKKPSQSELDSRASSLAAAESLGARTLELDRLLAAEMRTQNQDSAATSRILDAESPMQANDVEAIQRLLKAVCDLGLEITIRPAR